MEKTVFARELEGLLAIAAQNVRVAFAPTCVVRRIDLCSAVEHERTGRSLTVTLGDLVSADSRSVLVTFRVGAPEQHGWLSLGKLTVTYDDVVGGIGAKTLTHELLAGAMAPEKVAAIPADAAVVRELLILRGAKVLQAAIAQADTGDAKGAIQRLTAEIATIAERATRERDSSACSARSAVSLQRLRAGPNTGQRGSGGGCGGG